MENNYLATTENGDVTLNWVVLGKLWQKSSDMSLKEWIALGLGMA